MSGRENRGCTPSAAGTAVPLRGPRSVLMPDDALFPKALRRIPHPPARLQVVGDVQALAEGIAIIGARKATPYGVGCARRFARLAARQGIVVVSGGALGCDSAAHAGALQAGGRTVVVFGGGCDCVYPARNRSLFQAVLDAGGAVVSERDWDEPPLPWMFRQRNRLIAGLCKATLVVEAGLPSGTFSTADEALAANREVLVVPGAITSSTSAGSNRLLCQGATPIVDDESFEVALSLLFGVHAEGGAGTGPAQADDPLLAALYANPMRLDELAAAGFAAGAGMEGVAGLAAQLAHYERAGLVARFPDGRCGPARAKAEGMC